MTGINANKIIQNLEFVNSFAPHHCSRALRWLERSRQGWKEKEKETEKAFSFSKNGFRKMEPSYSPYPLMPPRGAGMMRTPQPFNTCAIPGNGTQFPELEELKSLVLAQLPCGTPAMGPQINGCCAIVSPAGCGLSAGDPDGFGYGGRVRKPPTWCVAWRNAQNHSAGWVRAKAPAAGHVA